MSNFQKLEKLILNLSSSVKHIESEMGSMKSEMGSMKSEMNARFDNIENTLADTKQEMQDEAIATRSLINQAFEHISDQMSQNDKPIQPSIVFRTRRHTPV